MNKVLKIVEFILIGICILSIVLLTSTTNKMLIAIEEIKNRTETLETELSSAVGYDVTDEDIGDTSGVYDISSFEKIVGTDIEQLSKGKKIVIWLGRQGCSYCSLYAPTIKAVGKENNIKIYYIDIAAMYDINEYEWELVDKENYNAIIELPTAGVEAENVMNDFGSTPMTIIVENGKVLGGVTGAIDKSTLETTLRTYGLKK